MEAQIQKQQNHSKPMRKIRNEPPLIFDDDISTPIFALMLASLRVPADNNNYQMKKKKNKHLQKPNSHHQLQLQLLDQLHLSLLSNFPNPNSPSSNLNTATTQLNLPAPILSLLPALFTSKCAEVVCKCAKFVGAVSLYSLEMNLQIANDEETLKSLIFGLASWKKRSVLFATCNAALDVATTFIGRTHLLECSALDYIIASFLQAPKSSVQLEVALFSEERGSEVQYRIGLKEDELPVLLLDAAITFINTCRIEQLERIPKNLLESLLVYMKKLWTTTYAQILSENIIKFNQLGHFSLSNITSGNLAESMFRLSLNADKIATHVPLDVIERSIFCCDRSSFEDFILNHWEVSPLLMRSFSEASNEQYNFLHSFRQYFNFTSTVPPNIPGMLSNIISCPPIASDELDIHNFLNEVRGHLGFPMIYQQDIRVLKTQYFSGEMHLFKDPKFLYFDDILRCEEAYKEGYTIALRGMEFRFENIAAIVDGLAYLFGQPSAGGNMYLTPPNSQGLACHYDDHCVFVCQLIGAKKWRVFPRSSLLLPRLYEPLDSLHEADRISNECNHFVLREGDILYIPRGFFHEACTILENEKPNEIAEFSLHLTLAIEVEPPFEWEGFSHVALHNWFLNHKESFNLTHDLLSGSLNVISMNLMHVAIKLIGDKDPMFRKACLIGAISLLSDSEGRLYENQKTIFSHLIKCIDIESSFSNAVEIVLSSLSKNEDPFRQLRWLHHLNGDDDIFELHKWKFSQVKSESFTLICSEHREKVEASFMNAKSKFCDEVEFKEVGQCYTMLLEKYRKVRKHYTKGMLSLHCN